MSKKNAIDGERKSARNFREGNMGMGGTVYTPAEEPIRSDVNEILNMSRSEFENWYLPKKNALKKELAKYEEIAAIPNLQYGSEEQKHDMTANTHFRQHLEILREAKAFLEAIKSKWNDQSK